MANRDWRRFQFKMLLGALIFLSALFLLELGGKILLSRRPHGSPYNLIYQGTPNSSFQRVFFFSLIDPLLGWGRNPAFREYFSDLVPVAEREASLVVGERSKVGKRIVGLGGSTTDPELEAKNWVYYLAENCSKNKLRCQTLNGGIGGYNSGQEFLKLVRDVVPYKPDLVISLNGINDESLPNLDGRTFINSYQTKIEQALRVREIDSFSPMENPPSLAGFFPHVRFLWQLFAFVRKAPAEPTDSAPIGTVDRFALSQRWETNVRMMHAVSKELGFRYFVFLQPHLGLEPDRAAEKIKKLGIQYFYDPEKLANFYAEARVACRKMDYCADLSEEFMGNSELFLDIMHLYPHGHAWEADKMFQVLKRRGFL